MEQHLLTNTLEYKSKDGLIFKIRAQATRGDQNQFNIAMGDYMDVQDGKRLRANPLRAYPWLVERFVIGWSGGEQKTGTEILDAINAQVADPEEDLIVVLGAFIFNHVKGLQSKASDEGKKKG